MAVLPGFGITVPDYPAGITYTQTGPNSGNWSGIDTSASNPLWQQWAQDAGLAPKPEPEQQQQQQTVDTSQADYYNWLKQQQIDAANAAKDRLVEVTRTYFQQNGMEAFISGMEKYIRAGYSGDEVMIMLSQDADYKAAWDTRFAGNVARKAAGLAELLPASYIALEQGYKSLFQQYGVPATLFDDPSDFAELIGRDVSPVEVKDRLDGAAAYINYSGNEAVKSQLRELYSMTDDEMFAYVLDPTRTQAFLDSESRRNFARANVGGAAITAGVDLAGSFRDEIASLFESANSTGSAFDASLGKFQAVAGEAPNYTRLGALSFEQASSDELVREQFDMAGGAQVTNKKKALATQERARFGGSSALGSTSLSAGRQAQ